MTPGAATPFRIDIPEAQLTALRARLGRTRWPREIGDNALWQDGVSLAWMRETVAYWLEGYDWRAQERAINALPQFLTEIDGVPIHFVHVHGKGPSPAPLILSHGWPETFWDLREIIGPLTDPAAHGGDAADAFDVVIPSLPGFTFSSPLTTPGMNHVVTADLWAKLMTELGYGRFGAQGGDLGALVAAQLGHRHGGRVTGLHLHAILSAQAPYLVTHGELTGYGAGEEDWAARNLRHLRDRAAWLYVQRTRPQSAAFALQNSPVGLAAWLIDARRMLSQSEDGVDGIFSRDELLTNVMLYWLTDTFATSAGHFYNARPDRSGLVPATTPVVGVPTAVIQFERDAMLAPRRWAEAHFNLQRWTMSPEGGRFAALQAPKILVEDLRAFFRPLPA